MFVSKVLSDGGHEVRWARDWSEVPQKVGLEGATFDMILLDLNLGGCGVEGETVGTWTKMVCPNAVRVIYSSDRKDRIQAAMIQLDTTYLLPKNLNLKLEENRRFMLDHLEDIYQQHSSSRFGSKPI